MPEIGISTTVVFLTPGLLIYCALYGVFGGNDSGGQEPPDAKSIKALTIILLGSGAVHAVTALIIALASFGHAQTGFLLTFPGDRGGYYETLLSAAQNQKSRTPGVIGYLVAATMLQCAVSYMLIRWQLNRLARKDSLPIWLYGWTAPLANQYGNDDTIVLAEVLVDVDDRQFATLYVGIVRQMTVVGGSVQNVMLVDAQRFRFSMRRQYALSSLAPIAEFDLILLDKEHIRNIAFQVVPLGTAAPLIDVLATGFARLYGSGQTPLRGPLATTIS